MAAQLWHGQEDTGLFVCLGNWLSIRVEGAKDKPVAEGDRRL